MGTKIRATAMDPSQMAGMGVNELAEANQRQQKNEEMRGELLQKIFHPKAQERLDRLKLVKADHARMVEDHFLNMAHKGQIRIGETKPVTVEMLKAALEQMGGTQATAKKIQIRPNTF